LLNARQLPGYVPAAPIYTPGGGNPNLIRRGFSQDPDTLNVYQATTVWDFEVISQVFDSMLAVNPTTGGADQQVIDWMTTSHSQTFQPNELGCIAGPSVAATSCVKGITTQTWHLRNDLFFHDNTPVTAQDVVYSILTQRDDPSANGFPSVAFVTNAVALDSRTVQVKLESNSAFYELNIGGVPIVPQHLYQGPGGSICGSISSVSTPAGPANAVLNGPASACADPAFDPLTCTGTAGLVAGCGTTFADGSFQGIFVGSAGYVCNNVDPTAGAFNGHVQAFGKAGGSCAQSGAGAVIGGGSFGPDSRALLVANTNYMRGLRGAQGNGLQKASWADYNKDGVVNILDASNAAFFFDSSNSYWTHPQYACSPTATTVDVCVMSAIVVFFEEGVTSPFGGTNVNPSTQLSILDPQIDPYSTQLSGTNVCLYYQSTTTAATKLILVSCNASGPTTLPTGHAITAKANHLESPPVNLSVDSKLKFVDSPVAGTPNAAGTWTSGKTAIYDNNVANPASNGKFIAAGSLFSNPDFIVPNTGPTPVNGTNLSVDPKIKFVDVPTANTPNAAGTWLPASGKCPCKTVIEDTDSSGTFTLGDIVISGTTPAFSSNGTLGPDITGTVTASGSTETVTWSSALSNGHYEIRIYDTTTTGTVQIGQYYI
jgi:hypothetical protein